jgi:hypothetical protein
MKRLFLLGSILLITTYGCQKEDIQKNDTSNGGVITLDGTNDQNNSRTSGTTRTVSGTDTDSGNGTGITDPNSDPDLNKKKIKN